MANHRRTYYHGTKPENIDSILLNGFNPGTWFADKIEHAVKFGGPVVFLVDIKWYGKRAYDWQILSSNRIPARQIVGLKHMNSIRKAI